MIQKSSFTHIKGKRGQWTWVSEHCCNTSRNSIFFPHCVLLLILWGGNLREGQSGPSLPALWPWVPVRYKSVRAGQHSSEQVNRASSNPLEALSLLELNNGFYKCWHLQTWTVWHSGKQNSPVSKRGLHMAEPVLSSICSKTVGGKLEGNGKTTRIWTLRYYFFIINTAKGNSSDRSTVLYSYIYMYIYFSKTTSRWKEEMQAGLQR